MEENWVIVLVIVIVLIIMYGFLCKNVRSTRLAIERILQLLLKEEKEKKED